MAKYIATCFFIGHARYMPGTLGTLFGAIFAYIFTHIFPPIALVPASAVIFLAGWWATSVYQKNTSTMDPPEIIIDEVCGILLTLSIVPVNIAWYSIAIVIFRVFDIAKPYPISKIDKGKTAFHVMFDDVIAGAFSALTLWILAWINVTILSSW